MKKLKPIGVGNALLIGLTMSAVSNIVGHWMAQMGYGDTADNSLIILIVLCVLFLGRYAGIIHRHSRKTRESIEQLYSALVEIQLAHFPENEVPDRMTVNAAMDRLIQTNGEDQDAIHQVLAFASKIRPTGGNWQIMKTDNKPEKGIKGLTWEMGEVEIPSEERLKTEVHDFEKVRVGQYKMWREVYAVFFQHFWARDPGTSLDLYDAYRGYSILFQPTNFQAVGFGELKVKNGYLVINLISGQYKGETVVLGDVR